MNLTSPREMKELLERHDFNFSKGLGQNFLTDQNIVSKIVDKASIVDKNVLEIGPGIGTLTSEIAKYAKKVVAVEVDKRLEPILSETLEKYNNIEVVFQDILKTDIKTLSEEKFNGEPFKVVANLPYYITSPILIYLLREPSNIEEIVVMMQREVADRIVAGPNSKEYGSISVFLKYFGDSEIVMKVPKTVFMPKPKVDSAILKIVIKDNSDGVCIDSLERVLRSAFLKRRKTILNSLSSGLDITKEETSDILKSLNIDENFRAENLSYEDYLKITKKLGEKNDI